MPRAPPAWPRSGQAREHGDEDSGTSRRCRGAQAGRARSSRAAAATFSALPT